MSKLITRFWSVLADRVTGYIPNINSDHVAIHKGEGYRAHLELGVFGESTSKEYSLKTPENLYLHFKNMKLAALGGTVKATIRRGTEDNELRIDSSGSTTTDLVGPYNLNDNSSKTTGVEIKEKPTYDDTGTGDGEGEDWETIQVLGDGTNQFTSVAETQGSPNEEIVFKPDTFYVIELEEVSGDASNVLLTMFWYEEGDG